MSDLRKILADATPGPWEADGAPWNRIVCSATNRVCFVAHSDGLNDERDIATSELVALAPDLAAEVLALREENAKQADALLEAEGALAFYADKNRQGLPSDGPWGLGSDDFGKRALAALSDIKKITGGGNG